MIEIVMYTGDNCGKCKGAKFNLSNLPAHIKENLNLIERNVDKDKEAYEFMTKIVKSNSLPTFLIEDSQGSYEYNDKMFEAYIGFEENVGIIMEVLGL